MMRSIRKRVSKGLTYLALITMIAPTILEGQSAFATEQQEPTIAVENPIEGTVETEEQTEAMTEFIDQSEIKFYTEPQLNGNGMYTIGQTADGKLIESSAVSVDHPLSRATGNVQGETIRITIGGILYEGIKITVDGKGALCIDQSLRAPFEANVPYDNGVPYENVGVKAILAHGAYGYNNPNPTDEEIICTEIALRNWLTGKTTVNQAVSNSHPYIADLISKAQSGNYFDKKISLSKSNVESTIQGNEQVSDVITVSGDTDNTVSIPVPKDVTLTNINTGATTTNGVAKVNGGQSFKLSAPLNYSTKYQSGNLKSKYGAYTALMFTPFDAGYQRLMQGSFSDPLEIAGFSVNFFARLGNAEFQKLSDVSDLPLANVTYKVKIGNEAEKELTTDSNGNLFFKDIVHGTDILVTEITNPEGYILDSTTYQLTIVGGQTVSRKLTNKIQKGKVNGQKFKEVFSADQTWTTGTPIYDTVVASNIRFDLVALTDITLPDKKTVVVPKGTVVDHVVTDSNGHFSSNLELYIGGQNKYKLVETNVPDNYRNPSDIQTEFSIPYGKNTESLLMYDLGKIDNLLKTTNVTFNKKNALDVSNILNLEGAEFLVEGLSPNVKHVQFMFTTKKQATLLKLLADTGSATYKFTEIKTPNGFGQPEGTTETRIITVKDGQDLTINWENMPLETEITTVLASVNGEKTIDATIDNQLEDIVKVKHAPTNVPVIVETEFVVVDKNNQLIRSLGKTEDTKTFTTATVEFSVTKKLPKNTVKAGEKIVATHVFYNKDKTIEYGREYDLTNTKQTVEAYKPTPKIETVFASVDGEKTINPAVDNELEDIVKVTDAPINVPVVVVTEFVVVNSSNQLVRSLEVIEETKQFKKADVEFSVTKQLEKNTLKDGENIVATHIFYNDDKTVEYGREYDLTNKKQTVFASVPKSKIQTLFATVDGKKVINPTVVNQLKDIVKVTDAPVNVPVTIDTEFVVVDKNDQLIRSLGHVEEIKVFEEATTTFEVYKELDKNTLKDGESIVATHIFYNEDKTVEYGREYNLSNKEQTIQTKTPVTVQVPTTPQKVGSLPHTGEKSMNELIFLGISIIVLLMVLIWKVKWNKKMGI